MKIKFVINKWRKGKTSNSFNPRLSSYWRKQYYDMFRGG